MQRRWLILLGAVVVIGAIVAVYSVSSKKLPELNEDSFPQALAGMPLVHLVTGEQAIAQISKLHGTNIPIENGYIAMYRSEDRQAVLWISESATSEEAEELLKIMDEKMPGSSAFSNYTVKVIDGKTYYYVTGIGMHNYYYLKGNRVYWLGTNVEPAEDILKEAVKLF
ncbi:hypothetical protein [Calderihabitans maritimus]|uniref:DUF4367 domain-containing protein n=1 Tax=Calderihabitans maritimus TaxID=1246530 RepID=A0A1Z5HW51_9FIRM|nr:hypothetical protein [Calderihabitans maritimus]GAW93744.1 hypothetical protein KKC1_28720 [Calderihabitans maritimus]